MRIGLFTDSYLPAMNGIVHVVESARINLEKLGHTVYVVAPKPGLQKPEHADNVLWIPAVSDLFFEDQLTSVFFPPLQYRKIAKLKLDAVVFFTPSQIGLLGAYYAKRQEIPLVSQYCTDVVEYIEQYPAAFVGALALAVATPFMLNFSAEDLRKTARGLLLDKDQSTSHRKHIITELMTLVHRQCDAVVAVSPKMAKQLKSWDPDIDVQTIPTGVDPLPVDPKATTAFKKQFGINEEDKVVMYAGRLAPEKNLDLLIDAFDHIGESEPEAKLVFVGDFSYREKLEARAQASKYAERIVFTGRLPRAELGSVYAAAKVFVFPSLTDTQALVINEAALTGLPLVWIDKNLNDVIIDKKTGLRANNNPEDFAAKVVSLLSDDKKRIQYGQAAEQAALPLSEKFQTTKLADLLTELIERRLS